MSIESPGNQRTGDRAEPLTSPFAQDANSLGSDILSVAVIGPEPHGRKAVAKAVFGFHAGTVREFSSYPELDDLPKILNSVFDVIVVELDTNPEHALDLVEHICGQASATVMVYSAHTDSELLVRCMRAGAREFLTQPIAPSTIAEAMVRASVRRPVHRTVKQAEAKLLVFLGAKGGAGVSTLAANFAVALAQDSRQRVALLDLGMVVRLPPGLQNRLVTLILAIGEGRAEEAETLYKESLAIIEKSLPGDPILAGSLNNLAQFYRTRRRLPEAAELFNRALAIYVARYGDNHTLTATVINNLAGTYLSESRFDAAEPLYRRGLAASEKLLGPEHYGVAISLDWLAQTSFHQKRYPEAESQLRRGIAIAEKATGPDSQLVVRLLDHMISAVKAQGREQEAAALKERAQLIIAKSRK